MLASHIALLVLVVETSSEVFILLASWFLMTC